MKIVPPMFSALLLLLTISTAHAQQQSYIIEAHPAIWTVHTPTATAYLLGSIHLLPPNVRWQTPQIDAAMKKADTFVFEVPIDDAATKQIADYINANGTLPPGTTLPSLLSPAQLKDYNAALAATGVQPDAVMNKRPWLAALVFDVAGAMHAHYSLDSGVDHQVNLYAQAQHKQIAHFETVADQLALFTPKDKALEIKEFDTGLKEIVSDPDELNRLVEAWESGDAARVGSIMNAALAKDPDAAKALLEDRNAKWVAELRTMLAQRHTYFIAVGAGHLVGPKSVPALLRADGYKVDGP
jgi:uncharacterized protein YbaP (TraB family)